MGSVGGDPLDSHWMEVQWLSDGRSMATNWCPFNDRPSSGSMQHHLALVQDTVQAHSRHVENPPRGYWGTFHGPWEVHAGHGWVLLPIERLHELSEGFSVCTCRCGFAYRNSKNSCNISIPTQFKLPSCVPTEQPISLMPSYSTIQSFHLICPQWTSPTLRIYGPDMWKIRPLICSQCPEIERGVISVRVFESSLCSVLHPEHVSFCIRFGRLSSMGKWHQTMNYWSHFWFLTPFSKFCHRMWKLFFDDNPWFSQAFPFCWGATLEKRNGSLQNTVRIDNNQGFDFLNSTENWEIILQIRFQATGSNFKRILKIKFWPLTVQ